MANFNEKSISSLERKVISDILNDPEVLDNITNKLEPQDFLNKELGIIFSAAQALNKESKAVDPHTVINYLDSHDELQFDGYSDIVISLYNQFTTSVDVDDHVDLIKNASIKRKMDAFAAKIVDTKFDPTVFTDQMFNMEQEFMAIAGSKKNIKLKRIGDITASYQDKLNTILDQADGGYFGTTSGYKDIDKITNGFQPGDLIILAARPGIGKTALALNFLLNAAEDIKKKQVNDPTAKKDVVVMFSLEMGAEQLCQRLISMHSLIDLSYRNIKNISSSE
ncbi:MAG: AAA family ATPase [Mycoplasmoidaceae bacterium]|nr:AAA family ATPase [Mycoplasmoidaceae bacterium]